MSQISPQLSRGVVLSFCVQKTDAVMYCNCSSKQEQHEEQRQREDEELQEVAKRRPCQLLGQYKQRFVYSKWLEIENGLKDP